MDITSVIADLRNQLNNVCQAILTLERLSVSQPNRQGRPRKIHAKVTTLQDGPHLALAARTGSDGEKAFDAHWQDKTRP